MNRHLTGKMTVALVIGLLLGLSINHSNAMWGRRGREAYMAHQEHLFNRFSAVPHTSIGIILTSAFATCLFIFFYELLVLGAFRILKAPPSISTQR
ncbi:MAG TPA: hypothetical protein VK627_00315 [Edaphobacter sp.]|nr:hypothetical protein [Edaphobacter sp.]